MSQLLLSKLKIVFLALAITALFACDQQSSNERGDALSNQDVVSLKVYKRSTCQCCNKWIDHMEKEGFDISTKNLENLQPIKSRYNIRSVHQSCHTAVSDDGYVFEGHIPPVLIKRFLETKPEGAVGLAVPGMPIGSPGMEQGARKDIYDVVLLKKDGMTEVFARVSGSEVLEGEHSSQIIHVGDGV